MGLFDSIRHAFNPEVKETFDLLYRQYYKGLKAFCSGEKINVGGYTIDTHINLSNPSYEDMKRIYESKDTIISFHQLILDREKMEAAYKELDELRKKYPHAFISICAECLGGIIYDSSIKMPGCRKSGDGSWSVVANILRDNNYCYYNGQYRPIGSNTFGTYSRIGNTSGYSSEPKTVKDLLYPDVIKILERKSKFPSTEQGILKLLKMEEVDSEYKCKVSNNSKRAKYVLAFLKSKGKKATDKQFVLSNLSQLDAYIIDYIDKEYKRIKSLFPNGIKVYEHRYSVNKENIIANEDKISTLEPQAVKFLSLQDWEKHQEEYTKYSRSIHLENFGCYVYDIPFETITPEGNPKKGNYRVWQHFCESYFCEPVSDSEFIEDVKQYNPQLIENAKKVICFLGKTITYRDSIYDKIYKFIKEIQEKFGSVTVVWGTSSFRDYIDINNYQFKYIRALLNENCISNVDASELSFPGLSRNLVILDITSTNDWLKSFCSKIITENPKLQPLITYISLCKAYDKKEIEDLIKKHKAKQEEELRKIEEAEKKRREKEEQERQLQKQKKLERNEIMSCVSSWHSLFGRFQYSYLLNYYPTTCDFEASEDEWEDRWTVWNFKNTPGKTSPSDHEEALETVIPQIKSRLISTFGTALLKKITLVCIPASTAAKTKARYDDFSRRICRETGMVNAYDYMQVTSSSAEKKFGGSGISTNNVSFDANFFRGKYVLLFDDVITKGESMLRFKRKMEELGAIVVGGMSIGKTKHNRI